MLLMHEAMLNKWNVDTYEPVLNKPNVDAHKAVLNKPNVDSPTLDFHSL